MKYKIAVSWTEVGIVEVEGISIKNAIEHAERTIGDIPLPEGEYLDESFRIDKDTTMVLARQEEEMILSDEQRQRQKKVTEEILQKIKTERED